MNTSELICCVEYLGCAVWLDIRRSCVPNWLTLSFAILGTTIAMARYGAAAGVVFSLKGFAVGFGILFIPFVMGGMGGGDVKLLAALGCWVGGLGVFQVFLYGAVSGGILSLGLIFHKAGIAGIKNIFTGIFLDMISFHKPAVSETGLKLPYALPMAIGFGVYASVEPIL